MRNTRHWATAVAIAAALFTPSVAFAQNAPGDWSVRVGALAVWQPDYEGSDDYEWRPVPDVEITYGDRLFLNRQGLGANLVRWSGLTAGVALGFDAGREQKENADLRGLGDVDETAVGSVFASYQLGRVTLSADLQKDVLGDGHDGMTATFSAMVMMQPLENLALFAGPSLTIADRRYLRAFFGVDQGQATRSGLAAYDPKAGAKNASLTLFGVYRLSDRWAATGLVVQSRLLDDAAGSPLVKRRGEADQFALGLGLSYQFR
ncbi:MAG TPA: MipA/OmpV family protein [Azospirillaceae bacterium]|nr:MipA/OmpV family protein [Azospirillaceae bacterium]